MNKIAFLFLTIDKKYSIYVHPKYSNKVSDSILKGNIIGDTVETKHGFLVEAMIKLMNAGLKDKDNKFFVFVSDSCIPIKKFNILYEEVFTIGKSIVGKMFLKLWESYQRKA